MSTYKFSFFIESRYFNSKWALKLLELDAKLVKTYKQGFCLMFIVNNELVLEITWFL